MPQQTINAGDSLLSLAQQYLGDSQSWREIADNNGFNPMEELPIGQLAKIPAISEIQQKAQPILSAIATGDTEQIAQTALTTIGGYIPEAQQLLGEVNGVVGEVKSVLGSVQQAKGGYKGEVLRLIDWLLQ